MHKQTTQTAFLNLYLGEGVVSPFHTYYANLFKLILVSGGKHMTFVRYIRLHPPSITFCGINNFFLTISCESTK